MDNLSKFIVPMLCINRNFTKKEAVLSKNRFRQIKNNTIRAIHAAANIMASSRYC